MDTYGLPPSSADTAGLYDHKAGKAECCGINPNTVSLIVIEFSGQKN